MSSGLYTCFSFDELLLFTRQQLRYGDPSKMDDNDAHRKEWMGNV